MRYIKKKVPHGSDFVAGLHLTMLPISFSITSTALGHSSDCPNAIEATLKDMDKRIKFTPIGLLT